MFVCLFLSALPVRHWRVNAGGRGVHHKPGNIRENHYPKLNGTNRGVWKFVWLPYSGNFGEFGKLNSDLPKFSPSNYYFAEVAIYSRTWSIVNFKYKYNITISPSASLLEPNGSLKKRVPLKAIELANAKVTKLKESRAHVAEVLTCTRYQVGKRAAEYGSINVMWYFEKTYPNFPQL